MPSDWNDTQSYAGLWGGKHWAWGVPYYVKKLPLFAQPLGVGKSLTLHLPEKNAGRAYVFFSPRSAQGTVAVQVPEGQEKTKKIDKDERQSICTCAVR